MNKYIGTNLDEAGEMNLITYNEYRGWQIPKDENPLREGYLVRHSNAYVSWVPKEEFDKTHLKVSANPKLKTDVSISLEMVDRFIKDVNVSTIGDKTTLVRAVLVNGFEIIEASACVDKENYSEKIGGEVCLGKIKDKIWMLLGFLLQTAVGGIK